MLDKNALFIMVLLLPFLNAAAQSDIIINGNAIDPFAQIPVARATLAIKGAIRSKIYKAGVNAISLVANHGVDLELRYILPENFSVAGTVSYAQIVDISNSDALASPFKTSTWVKKLSFGYDRILKNAGFNLIYRWQGSINWQGPLPNDISPVSGMLGAELTYRLPGICTTLKMGTNDLHNTLYYPQVGSLYYFTIVYEQNKARS